MRHRIPLTDREIAGKLLMRLARIDGFCLGFLYEDDADFLDALAKDLQLPKGFPCKPYIRRLAKICRHLQACGILDGQVLSCHKEYLGEPNRLKRYQFNNPSYAFRLAPDKYPHYTPMGKPEWELDFLLERAYPNGDLV